MASQLTAVDMWLSSVDRALRTLAGANVASRPSPAPKSAGSKLDEDERRLSGSLMRVNHVGEVCAQALYQAQGIGASDPKLREHFEKAAQEETDHLAWTKQRLSELGARPSLLNPVWFTGAFCIGLLAGRASDKLSLAFVVETERQVERHLEGHLQRLPAGDTASRAIVAQMQIDESRHASQAREAGGKELPLPVRALMRLAAKVMTTTAHYV
jgi:ubiquinone biosynthesis monooxygenase Coq7